MTRQHRAFLSIALSLATASALQAQNAGISLATAPPLGEGKYTVHAHGTLEAVVDKLNEAVADWAVSIQRKGSPAPGPPPRLDAPVALDFDGASLRDIVLSLCHQAGLVYDAWGSHGCHGVYLRSGDMGRDLRPAAELRDYFVRVDEITAESSVSVSLQRGATEANTARAESFRLRLAVIPKSPIAELVRPTVERAARVVTDTNVALSTATASPATIHDPGGILWDEPGCQVEVALPVPPADARMLKRIEGALRIPREVRMGRVQVPPNSVGQTLADGAFTVTVAEWKVEGPELKAILKMVLPLRPTDFRTDHDSHDDVKAVLVAKDGIRLQTEDWQRKGFQGPDTEFSYSFPLRTDDHSGDPPKPARPVEPHHIEVTYIHYGGDTIMEPFILRDVLLPQPPLVRVGQSATVPAQ